MVEKETSGALRSNSPTSKATGVAPGGPSLVNAAPPATQAAPWRQYGLRFLVALIKQSNQPRPNSGTDKGG
jgi:hypothetical protein